MIKFSNVQNVGVRLSRHWRAGRAALLCLFTLLLTFDSPAAETSRETRPPQSFVIGISPYLDKSAKDDVYRSVVRLLVEDLPLNSTVAIYDAFDLKSVAQVTLPNVRAF